MTSVTAGVPWPLLEEDRLNIRSECLESEIILRRRPIINASMERGDT
jgi:hypothetical protein